MRARPNPGVTVGCNRYSGAKPGIQFRVAAPPMRLYTSFVRPLNWLAAYFESPGQLMGFSPRPVPYWVLARSQ